DGRDHASDASHLCGEVARHRVHVVREVFPDAAYTFDIGLAAQLALGAHLTGDTGHLVGEGVELVDHHVDGVLELQDLALDVDGDLLGERSEERRVGKVGDAGDVAGEVVGQ